MEGQGDQINAFAAENSATSGGEALLVANAGLAMDAELASSGWDFGRALEGEGNDGAADADIWAGNPVHAATTDSAAARPNRNTALTAEVSTTESSQTKTRKRRKRAPLAGQSARAAALLRELLTMASGENSPPGLPALPERPQSFAVAFAVTAQERAAIEVRRVRQPKINVPNAIQVALSVVPFLDQIRPLLAKNGGDVKRIDRIDTYARSLSHAHALLTSATDIWVPSAYEDPSVATSARAGRRVITSAGRLQELSKQVTEARVRLRSDVRNLMVQGALPKTAFTRLNRAVGYRNTANDALALIHLVRSLSPTAPCRSTLSEATLDEFEAAAQELYAYAARRKKRGAPSEQCVKARDERARAFTLLWEAYREAQRVITALVWDKGDVRDVLPSLMVGVGRKKVG